MESKRLKTRTMLQRVITLTKHAHDFQSTLNAAATLSINNWRRQTSINIDLTQGLNINSFNQYLQIAYPLGPCRKFDFERAQKLLELELSRRCGSIPKVISYDPKQCLNFVQDLSQNLRRVLKSDTLNNIRYKIVVIVTIVQTIPDGRRNQSMAIVSRCLWDHETDGSITAQATIGHDMIAIATVFAVYKD